MSKQKIRLIIIFVLECFLFPFLLSILFISAFTARILGGRKGKPRLVWGEAPIINNVYWSNCMKEIGFKTETFTDSFCYRINERNEYDRVIQDEFRFIPLYLKYL